MALARKRSHYPRKIGAMLATRSIAMAILNLWSALSSFSSRPMIVPNRHQVLAELRLVSMKMGTMITRSDRMFSIPVLYAMMALPRRVTPFGLTSWNPAA